jgi:choline dehydrogenase-like flavoprotein
MAIHLKPVEIAMIGLGAAGGVAVPPVTRAGLRVAALEAGSWMQPSQFKPDEIHNNARRLVHYYANSWRFHPWDFKAR